MKFSIASLILSLNLSLLGQTAPVVLDVDIANTTAYNYDTFDVTKFGASPSPVSPTPSPNFNFFINFGDITAVNGEPAKGTWVSRVFVLRMSPAPAAGSMIADTNRFGIAEFQLEILREDGSTVGSIFMQGQNFGTPTPGAPAVSNSGAFAIVGGTGAFLGARGQATAAPARTGGGARNASIQEDPSFRRSRPGGGQRLIIQLIPNNTPEIAQVYHADFTPVTANSPARAGESLTVMAKGLGVTTPALEPGAMFGAEPLAIVSAPVRVQINSAGSGVAAVNQVGWVGTPDSYRVDFRLPDDTPSGSASVRLRAAWAWGSEFRIPVR